MVKCVWIVLLAMMVMPWHAIADDRKCPASVMVSEDIISLPSGWKSSTNKLAALSKSDSPSAKEYSLSDVHFVQYDDIDFLPPSQKTNIDGAVKYLWPLTSGKEYEIDCDYNESRIRLYRTLPMGLKTCEATYKKNDGTLSFSAMQCY